MNNRTTEIAKIGRKFLNKRFSCEILLFVFTMLERSMKKKHFLKQS